MMRTIKQPGQPSSKPYQMVPTEVVDVSLHLHAGEELLSGLQRCMSALGFDSGYFNLKNLAADHLSYVIPALAPDEQHTAWYSEARRLESGCIIEEASLTYGVRDNAPFFHCHGTWFDAKGSEFCGHLLPDTCILSAGTILNGIGFKNTRFEASLCKETNFALFQPFETSSSTQPAHALVRLTPNFEIGEALQSACDDLGWSSARVEGLGSIVGAKFEDGQEMESFATEFYIRQGSVSKNTSALDIKIVGLDGQAMCGLILEGHNAVLMTCEILLTKR